MQREKRSKRLVLGVASSFILGFVTVGLTALTFWQSSPAAATAACLNGDYAFKGGVETNSLTNTINTATTGYIPIPSGGVSANTSTACTQDGARVGRSSDSSEVGAAAPRAVLTM